jgi:cellulose synthase/poly-beta-1,6-N-acetylglucosamine synthase-like glycosyltransferase
MRLFCDVFMGGYLFLIALLSLYGLHRYWILYLYFRHYKWGKPVKMPVMLSPMPLVTIQLPVFNERYVVERLIDAICDLDYPRELLEIQLLDDSTDDTRSIALTKAEEMCSKGFHVSYIHRTNREGYKAGALAEGLQVAKGEFVAIFDADFIPPADFLRKTLPHFVDPSLGMVQTRWGHLNEDYSLLTCLQAIFLDGHFLLEHTARNRSGAFFNFNGTAGIWRCKAITSSGGWQHDTLTEDLDLSYRAQMNGWRFLFLPDVVCPAELPVDIHAFKTQQNRWTIGAIQTAKKMLPLIWRSPVSLKVKIESTFHLTGCVGYALMAILSLLLPLSLYFRTQSNWPLTGFLEGIALMATTVSVGIFYTICLKELYPDWKSRAKTLPLMISLGVGMCLSNTKAVFMGLTGKRLEFLRTPKFSVINRDSRWKQKIYRSGNSISSIIEMCFSWYFFIAFAAAYNAGAWASLPFIALFWFGYTYVAMLTALHGVNSGDSLVDVSQASAD